MNATSDDTNTRRLDLTGSDFAPRRGETYSLDLEFLEDDNTTPVDLTGRTLDFRVWANQSRKNENANLSNAVTVTSAALGLARIRLESSVIDAWAWRRGWHRITLITPGVAEPDELVIAEGLIEVLP